MSISKNRLSYTDIYEVWDKAMEDPKGIRLPFDTEGDAKHYRMRMNMARSIDREENRRTYEPGHHLHGQSAYDTYQVRLLGPIVDKESPTGETTFVYVEPRDKRQPEIELLSEVESDHG